ncbi:2'-deoxycytidine 5'-triphosphate deaminase [Paraburkholderia nemoris]|uniref:2'-deoxycytidine 5'-triphosphate deaminase domain-containing protein n=1 Tax=Paraburkholderia nemoris TaxID=2793076 RepID=UPI0038B86A98
MLTDKQIKKLQADKTIIESYDVSRVQPASYDMVVGTIFRNGKIIQEPNSKNIGGQVRENIESLIGNRKIGAILIEPGEVVTMLTKEHLNLPPDIAATAHAMNSQSSEGLLVLNPGHVDPGYHGPLTVVAMNLRKVPLALHIGDKIFTVIFEQLSEGSEKPYPSKNSGRHDFETSTNKKVVELSIGSLEKLLSVSKKDIRTAIAKHWMSKMVTTFTIIAAVAACGAFFFAMFPDLAIKSKTDLASTISAELHDGAASAEHQYQFKLPKYLNEPAYE